MGSLNVTCTLSKSTIMYGDKAKLMFMIKNPGLDTRVYHDSLLNHISFIIDAEYDDYGGFIVDENSFEVKQFLNKFNELYDKGKIEIIEEIVPEQLTFTFVMRVIERGYVSLDGQRLTYMACHDEIFKSVIDVDMFNKLKLSYNDMNNYFTNVEFKTTEGKIVTVKSFENKLTKYANLPYKWFSQYKMADDMSNDINIIEYIHNFALLDCFNHFYMSNDLFFEEFNYAGQTDNYDCLIEHYKNCIKFMENKQEDW